MKFIKSLLNATFTKGGRIFIPYIYIFLMLLLVGTMYVMRLMGKGTFSDDLILGSLGFVAVWVGILTADNVVGKVVEYKSKIMGSDEEGENRES